MKVTRDVVSDLWPVYEAGEASPDTRALVDDFLAVDPEFARLLRSRVAMPRPSLPAPADAELRALKRTRELVRGHAWLRGVRLAALVLTIFALMRVLSDTTWTTSPRMFLIDAAGATILWLVYCIAIARIRSQALRNPPPAPHP